MREVAPTKSIALALAEERQLMRQGFGFLDEKRMLLATEMLRLLRQYETTMTEAAALRLAAAAALAAATERHGLEALQRYPAPARGPEPPALRMVRFLGVPLRAAEPCRVAADAVEGALDPSPEAEGCRAAFAGWLARVAEAGLIAGNLERLAQEYRRVERRAKALENVLLPEVEATLKHVGEQLDILDQEEVIRVRTAGRQAGSPESSPSDASSS